MVGALEVDAEGWEAGVDVLVVKGGKLVGAAGLVPPSGFWPPSRYVDDIDLDSIHV